MMHKSNLQSTINSILLGVILIFCVYNFTAKPQKDIAFIDNVKLFNSFNMTKEIKIIEEAKIRVKRKELDSLYSIYQSIEDKKKNEFKNLQQQIAHKSKVLQELQDNYTNHLAKTVWARLNTYIKDHAEAQNLEIILGASGDGDVMFAEETIDITNKVLEFANTKYEGNN